jgi:hypothetical protein
MALKDMLKRVLGRDREAMAMEREEKLRRNLEQRGKSPEERDLERYLEKERQEMIKEELKKRRDREPNLLSRSEMMDKSNNFKEESNILHTKNIFGMKDTNMQKSMFFK